MLKQQFSTLQGALHRACLDYYGERLVSLAVFGSVARGTMRPDSDIDCLIVADPLPRGRMARMREFAAVETAMDDALRAAGRRGVQTSLSPVFKTPGEVRQGSLLFLDMVEEARILYDWGDFLRAYLDNLRERLRELGARRVMRGGGYYWQLKPDLKPGELISL
ncbi:MAG: nucleotidyltransferase family protein [Pseudomonadota bacterium]